MFAITGITGQVGGELARTLLAAKQPVRAVVRDATKGSAWKELGCEVALVDIGDAAALTEAFKERRAYLCSFRRTSIHCQAFLKRGPRRLR